MDAHKRPGSTDAALAALDGILQQLQALGSRMADERFAEQASFEKQMSAFRIGKDERQTRREAIQDMVKSLQEELQHLDEQDETDNDKAMRLQREHRGMTEQWRQTQQALKDRLSAAISPQMVHIHLRHLAALISV